MTKILFICHGNICRSVMAEMVMKELCRQAGVDNLFEIDSAAVSREEIGNDIYPPAKRKLREKGIPFSSHAARQITRVDYDYYDYIICADRSNVRWLERIIGEDTAHKVSLMMAWPQVQITNHKNEVNRALAAEKSPYGVSRSEEITNIGNVPDVSDPWYTGDFEAAYCDIDESCRAILKQLTLNI